MINYVYTYTNKHTSIMFTHLCLIMHISFHKLSCLSAHFTWNRIKAVTNKFPKLKNNRKIIMEKKESDKYGLSYILQSF